MYLFKRKLRSAIGPHGLNRQPSDHIIPTLQTSNPQPTYFLKEPRKQRERRGLPGNSFEKCSSSRRILVTSPRLLPKTHHTMFCFHQDTKTEWDCRRNQSVDPHLPLVGFRTIQNHGSFHQTGYSGSRVPTIFPSGFSRISPRPSTFS